MARKCCLLRLFHRIWELRWSNSTSDQTLTRSLVGKESWRTTFVWRFQECGYDDDPERVTTRYYWQPRWILDVISPWASAELWTMLRRSMRSKSSSNPWNVFNETKKLTVNVGKDLIQPSWSLTQGHNALNAKLNDLWLDQSDTFSEVGFVLWESRTESAFIEVCDGFFPTRVHVASNEIRVLQRLFHFIFTNPIQPTICPAINCDS